MPPQNDNIAPARAGRREWIGLAVIAVACVLYVMDLTVLHLAVPAISAVGSVGLAIMVLTLLRHVRTDTETDGQPSVEPVELVPQPERQSATTEEGA